VAVVGVGVDAVDVPRFADVLERRPGIEERLFTEGERAYARQHTDPVPHLAVRFAAKEAVMKALGVGLGAFAWHDAEVVRAERGAPSLVFRGTLADLAADRGVACFHLSLTHTATVAIAFVVAES